MSFVQRSADARRSGPLPRGGGFHSTFEVSRPDDSRLIAQLGPIDAATKPPIKRQAIVPRHIPTKKLLSPEIAGVSANPRMAPTAVQSQNALRELAIFLEYS